MQLWMELQWQLRWQLRPPFGTRPKQPNPSRIQAQPVQKPAPEKVPNVAFGRPQERWRKANANAWHRQTGSFESMKKTMQKPCSGWSCGWSCNGSFGGSSGLRPARSRNSQTAAGFKPNLSKNQPPKNCLTSPSDAHKTKKDVKKGQRQCLTSPDRQLRKHETNMQKPCSGWGCGWSCNGSFGGSSGLRSARGRNSQTPAGFKPNLSKNQPPKKCLTSPSDAHKKDEERPTPMPDIARQAASKAWKNHAKTM